MTEEQANKLIAILSEMQKDISCIKTEMKKQREEMERIRRILRNV